MKATLFPTALLLASTCVHASNAVTLEDAKATALKCSDGYLTIFATRTQESVDTIAEAAFTQCETDWQRVAALGAAEKGRRGDDYLRGFLIGVQRAYVKYARPKALLLRAR